MKCILLAAGYATRLYPLTTNYPKPLLKVGEKTILDWLIDDIHSSGQVDEYAVVTNHRFAPIFSKWKEERMNADRVGQNLIIVDDGTDTNETRLGAVRDIEYALRIAGFQEDVLVVAGDNVLDFSLCSFIDYAKEKKASCLMRYYEPDENRLKKCGVAEVNENDLVISMVEKPSQPKAHWCTPPFYFLTAEDAHHISEAIRDGCGVDAPGSFISWLCKVSLVYAMEMPGNRYDIGTVENYKNVKRTYKGIIKMTESPDLL